MPCLYVSNLPEEGVAWDPVACWDLYRSVAQAAGVGISEVAVYLEDTRHRILRKEGRLDPRSSVRVVVEWFRRPQRVKDRVARIVQQFLDHHRIGDGSDITFRDSPLGSFYFYGERVK